MKKILLSLMVVAVVAFGGLRTASAQSQSALVKVPFDFIVGDRVLPSGSYRVAADTQDPTLLRIESTMDRKVATFAATLADDGPRAGDVQAAFTNVDGHMFLSRITMPGGEARRIAVNKTEAERTLARLNLMPAEVQAEPVK